VRTFSGDPRWELLDLGTKARTSEIGRKGGLAWMMVGQNILLFNFPFHALLYLHVTYYPSTFLFTNLLLQAGMLKGVPLFLLLGNRLYLVRY